MKVLIGCEISGTVRDAFRKLGHNAFSCDLKFDSSPYHLQGDILKLLNQPWDLLIAFPPCTHLAASGAAHFHKKEKLQTQALDFVKELFECNIKKICIENPIGVISTRYKKQSQIIQPYDFGDPERKTTCLWLKNLPLLDHTSNLFDWSNLSYTPPVKPEIITLRDGSTRSKFEYEASKMQKNERAEIRSKTFQGIANAMAEQWGGKL